MQQLRFIDKPLTQQDTTQNTPYSVFNTRYQPSLNTTNNRSQYKNLIL